MLSSARMKGVWALVPLLASSGCLFLDVPNTPPAPVQIIIQTQDNTKGTPIDFHADTSDAEDGGRLGYSWSVRAVDPPALDPNCDVEEFQGGGPDHLVAFYRTGMFEVTATATDSGGASSSGSIMITIDNAAPTFTGAGSAVQSSSYNLCGNNSAGQDITVHLDGAVQDDDFGKQSSYPGCMPTETLGYRWILSDWPGGAQQPVLTAFDGTSCAPATAASGKTLVVADAAAHVCVKTNSGPGTYTLKLQASDDGFHSFIESHAAVIAVGPDQPPCITGTEPVAGSYVVDRTQPQSFYVDGAVDDLDAFDAGISYVWSVYRYADNTWRDVPSWSLSTYTLDLSSFGVGEQLLVRVEALDRTMQRDTTCSKSADDCTPYSCVTTVCHKWKTWHLELR